MTKDNSLIWYVSYGSNLSLERFKCYILGGKPLFSDKNHIGCRKKELPLKERSFYIPYDLYFSKRSASWENQGVAFINPQPGPDVSVLCKAYLIRKEQFTDIFLQENSKDPFKETILLNFEDIIKRRTIIYKKEEDYSWYGRIIYIDKIENIPAFTFTATWDEKQVIYSKPGTNYLKTIITGIRETMKMDKQETAGYLLQKKGIQNNYTHEEMLNLINTFHEK